MVCKTPCEFKHAGAPVYGFDRFTVEAIGSDFRYFIKGKRVAGLACGAGGKSVWMAMVGRLN